MTMDEKKMQRYVFEVGRTVRQVLDLLTRKREFALITLDKRLSCTQEEKFRLKGYSLCEIADAGDVDGWRYLVIGVPLAFVHRRRWENAARFVQTLEDYSASFLPVGELYRLLQKPDPVRGTGREHPSEQVYH